ncbi:hypothetical protein Rs2_43112 [Raphanus sativus]|nr:hypothetical protein Rs2_43112 [Raphanus sativus]
METRRSVSDSTLLMQPSVVSCNCLIDGCVKRVRHTVQRGGLHSMKIRDEYIYTMQRWSARMRSFFCLVTTSKEISSSARRAVCLTRQQGRHITVSKLLLSPMR